MMKKIFLFALALSVLASCSKDDNDEVFSVCFQPDSGNSYIYRERDANSPLILSVPREHPVTRMVELKFDNILGRSFKLDFFPFESMQNIGEPVINLTKLEIDKPDWITKMPLRQSTSAAFSYSTFDRYEENSTVTKKVNSGFQINFGLFKIGNKNTYYRHFASSLIQSSNSIFGQLDIEIKDASYNLSVNSNRLDQIRKDYIQKDFIDNLYNLPQQELISFYGPFVMTNFITGGRATALFAGITKTTMISEAREQTMDREISTSFTFKKDANSSISLGFGKGFTNGSSSTEAFTQLYTSLTTCGGLYGLGAFTTPRSIDDMNVDLTAWVNSLNNANLHSLIDIQENGLIPLSGFFIEANLKAQYEQYVAGKDLPVKNFVEPMLVNRAGTFSSGERVNQIYLITRFNDAIIIQKNRIPPFNPTLLEEATARFHQVCACYKIKVQIGGIDENDFNSIIDVADYTLPGNNFVEGIVLESKMKKYFDANHEILYLLYDENGKKVGYTIYMGKGDYLLDTYGIRDWVNSLSNRTITDRELSNYKLIAF